MTAPPLAYVVDDEPDVRESIAMLLRSVSIKTETYASASRFLEQFSGITERPAILLLDVRMGDIGGMTVLELLRAEHPRLPVIMITGHGDIEMAVTAMKMGARDFLTKPFRAQSLLERVQQELRKSDESHSSDLRIIEGREQLETLTKRERAVFDRLVLGDSNKLIAIDLGISIRTVEAHRANLKEKLGANNLADLVRISIH
ncbi:Transcriptional regulatory protein TdiR [Thiorhodovibrio winogradskyi]|uniref:Transcriptional regulatory protein TdiR n=1 Tax=Thiorhodovibrio winogradskyi TaxID=77007 RepID=A0ABZ0S7K9_9GAMM|nr:response regulator [Thiorhodovibrio winogradskyi]